MSHWTEDFYRCVDAGDPAVAGYFDAAIRCQVGNDPPSVGVPAMFAGAIGRNVAVIRGSTHEFLNIWDVGHDTAVLESKVTYHRKDGVDVTVPATTIVHRNGMGLIDELRLYIDTTPLFVTTGAPT